MNNKNWKELLRDSNIKALSKELKVSRQTIYNFISGKHRPKLEHAKRIAKKFNIPLDEI